MGDFNAHYLLCFSELPEDNRGNLLVEQIDDSTFSIINENHSREALAVLSSDHLHLMIKVDDIHRFVADCAFVDNKLSQLPLSPDTYSGEQKFPSIVTKGARSLVCRASELHKELQRSKLTFI